MKKIALTLAGIAFVAVTLTSCKKDYTCTCTFDIAGVSGSVSETQKLSKKDAEEWCEGESTTGVTCKLD
jgi:hypothetical protein